MWAKARKHHVGSGRTLPPLLFLVPSGRYLVAPAGMESQARQGKARAAQRGGLAGSWSLSRFDALRAARLGPGGGSSRLLSTASSWPTFQNLAIVRRPQRLPHLGSKPVRRRSLLGLPQLVLYPVQRGPGGDGCNSFICIRAPRGRTARCSILSSRLSPSLLPPSPRPRTPARRCLCTPGATYNWTYSPIRKSCLPTRWDPICDIQLRLDSRLGLSRSPQAYASWLGVSFPQHLAPRFAVFF